MRPHGEIPHPAPGEQKFEGAWQIAGVGLSLRATGGPAPPGAESLFERFRAESSGDPRVEIEAELLPGWTHPDGLVDIFPDCRHLQTDDVTRIDRHDLAGELVRDGNRYLGKFVLDNTTPGAMITILQVCLIQVLADRGGLMLHASGAIRDNKLWLFSGRADVGKTTAATELKDGGETFTVDRAVLALNEDGSWRARPTPIGDREGLIGDSEPMPAQALVFLEQATDHSLHRLNPDEAARLLLANVLSVDRSPEHLGRILQWVESIVEQIPCYRLEFSRDPGFWRLLDHA